MAVGHLLLQSFWANEAIFQLMMLAYNLFLLFNMDFAGETEYRQQIKTFRLKYIFLAGKIIRTARSVVLKLSERYPYQERYEKACFRNITLHGSICCFEIKPARKNRSDTRICESGSQKIMHTGGNDAKLTTRSSKSSTLEMKMLICFIRRGISVQAINRTIQQLRWHELQIIKYPGAVHDRDACAGCLRRLVFHNLDHTNRRALY
jgi:hypothetical protein